MASVKKTMKSSETKPGARSLKAKASKRFAEADSKAKKSAAQAAAKKEAAKKFSTKKSAVKKPAASNPVQKVKAKTKAAAATSRATTPARAGKKTAAAARAAALRSGTARTKKSAASRPTVAKRAAEAKPAVSVKRTATGKTAPSKLTRAPKKTATSKISSLKAARAAGARKPVDSKKAPAVQKPAADKAAALSALKRNVARLSDVRRRAAATRSSAPSANTSTLSLETNLSLESNERMAVNKEPQKKMSTGPASGQAATNAARPPAKDTTAKEAARVAAKGAGTPLDTKFVATGPVSVSAKAPLPIPEKPAAALAPVAPGSALLKAAEAKPAEKAAISAPKPGKTASPQRPLFKPGEFVVYPSHGVGQILAIEEQEVAGFKLELFVISFIKDKMILKVPTPKVASVGMRKLSDASAVKAALDTLAGRARIKRTMWSRRAQEYEAKINSGDLNAIAEVVRDLYRSDTQPEQSYSERQLYEAALDRMTREIIVVQKLTETESLKLIEAQLQKGPRRGKAEEIEPDESEIEEAA